MTKAEFSRKKGRHNLKRKKERELKNAMYLTAKGRSLWNTRKHGKFVSQLIGMGYTQDEARNKASNIFVFVKG